MSAQLLPLPAPALTAEHAGLLARLVENLDANALWWLSGYSAALAQTRGAAVAPAAAPRVPAPAAAPVPAPVVVPAPVSAPAPAQAAAAVDQGRLTVVYGSQTGNARRIAEQLAQDAEGAGLAVRLLRADAYPVRELASERLLYVVISTQGDGEPPDDARALVEFIAGKRAPKLPQLRYAVLGLGDSSYPQFCAVGRQLDARLAELGASRVLPAGEADLDFDTVATPWRGNAVAQARETLGSAVPVATVTPLRVPAAGRVTRERPHHAEVLQNQRITGRGSDRDVRHVELSLAGSGLTYAPGDALGVWPRNPAPVVDAVLEALRLDPETPVAIGDEALPLREWLAARRELTRLARPWLAGHAARADASGLHALLQPDAGEAFAQLLSSHQVVDVLRRWPAAWDAQALVESLRPLAPRLYSIASSMKAVGDEAHLALDVLAYEAFGFTHYGAASGWVAALGEGAPLPVYVEPNERFRLPADPSRDVIMIGPGTGVAPYRGFLQERVATGAGGRNWLFFGNPHFRSDFLYQLEWQAALKDGSLHRLDLAFSRDGLGVVQGSGSIAPATRRTYVQHRLAERAREVHDWLEGGAHLYVCGSIAMGRDVHATLRGLVAARRGTDAEGAEAWLSELQRQGRYARDVY